MSTIEPGTREQWADTIEPGTPTPHEIRALVAELDRLSATVACIQHELADIPTDIECPEHPVGDPISCGWKGTVQRIRAALDGPPTETEPSDGGLHRKYLVERIGDTEGKHAECRYLVLDPAHDPHAVTAINAYAEACAQDNPTLAADLCEWTEPSDGGES